MVPSPQAVEDPHGKHPGMPTARKHLPVSKTRADTTICQHRPALPVERRCGAAGTHFRRSPCLSFPCHRLSADHSVLPRTELGRHHSVFLRPPSAGDRKWGCPGDTEATGTQEFASPVTLQLPLLKQGLCEEVGTLWGTGEGTQGLPRVSGCASPCSRCLRSPLPASTSLVSPLFPTA